MMSRSRTVLLAALVVAGLGEVAMTTMIDFPPAAVVFAAAFLLVAVLLSRRMRTIPAVVGMALFAIDGGGTPFYARSSWQDWAVQLTFATVCVVGIGAGIAALVAHRRAARTELSPAVSR
jgi:hypothetical protein